jgi:hypothetical protein
MGSIPGFRQTFQHLQRSAMRVKRRLVHFPKTWDAPGLCQIFPPY